MRSTTIRLLLLGLFLVSVLPAAAAPAVQDSSPFGGVPEQSVLHPLPKSATRGTHTPYLSPVSRTSTPFTHLLVRRDASVPAGATLTLFVRASADNQNWTDWRELAVSDDLWMTSDGPNVQWSEVVAVGGVARFWQVRGELVAAPDGSYPVIHQIDVNTVDTRLSPEQAATQRTAERTARSAVTRGVGKPAVVSRIAWGSPDGQGSRTAPAYYPVNHLIVHHTADPQTLRNGEDSWDDRVRAEWSFHTITRGWGDIGYNYIIDPNGVIYEGRAGGDDAVGFHDTANYGSMGVSVIGTYTDVGPSQASQESLVELLAWKANQKNIDPLASSYYYGCAKSAYCAPKTGTSVIANIAGHRQVTPGHTTCPGDAFMAIMPQLRYRVAQLIAGVDIAPDNGDLQVDEFEDSFSKSDANWNTAACGAGGNTFYTYATDNVAESTNNATWRPRITKAGSYRVYASIPQNCGFHSPPYATRSASYLIQSAGGSVTKTIDHNTVSAWADLGVYSFSEGDSGFVRLSDLTGEPYSATTGKVIFFDAVKLVPEDSASTDVALIGVTFSGVPGKNRLEVPSGGLLKLALTVENRGQTTAYSQEPQASLSADGSVFNDGSEQSDDAYVYDEGECFIGNQQGSYGAFPKEANRFRVILGTANVGDSLDCAGETNTYPWRWGLNGPLAPGQQRTIVGYVRFRNPSNSERKITLRAGLVQEYVQYYAADVGATELTITPETSAPIVSELDPATLLPLARVYTLGAVPSNFLARTTNPLSVAKGSYVGSFAWNGVFLNWGNKGPLANLSDGFVIEQTRAFRAPVSGEYTFRTSTDDGSWLWVNGQQVLSNGGLHDFDDAVTGTIRLNAGQIYTLAFKYFERSGNAAAGYDVAFPGESRFQLVPDASTEGGLALGTTFVRSPRITIAADDLGGMGVAAIRYSLNNGPQQTVNDTWYQFGTLQNGSYSLTYNAIDQLGNALDSRTINFTVDTNRRLYQSFSPFGMRP